MKIMMRWYNHILDLGGLKFLFPNLKGDKTIIPGSRILYLNLRQQWIKLLERSGIKKERIKEFGLHSIRISAATNASMGCEELEIQRLGRWRSGQMARHYIHSDKERQARPGLVLLG